MLFESKLAWKYFRTGRSRLVRFTSIVAVAGIAVGLASFIIAQSLSRGFAAAVRDGLLKGTGHITVTVSNVSAPPELVAGKIRLVKGVTRVEETTFEPAALMVGGQLKYVVLRAVPDDSAGFGKAVSSDPDHEDAAIPIIPGKRVADGKPGDALLLFSGADGGGSQMAVSLKGAFSTGVYEYDSTWLRIRKSDLARLKGLDRYRPGAYTVFVDNIYDSGRIAGEIRKALGGDFEVVDWQEANRPLFSALALERKIALWIISLIVIVALLNITTTLSLLVKERLPDIAVLRTCGANTKKLASVFLLEGWILSLAGIAIGVAAGVGISLAAGHYRLIKLPGEVYAVESLPFNLDLADAAAAAGLTFILCTLSMAVPVFNAARAKPMENLRLR